MMRRRFVDCPAGQVHLWSHPGRGVPVLMLHAAPGSARMLGPLQTRLHAPSIALDLPGMGDSDPLHERDDKREAEIDDYVDVVFATMDALELEVCDLYGTLSGVRVALGLARRGSDGRCVRVRRVVLDGIGVPKPDELKGLLAHYAPEFVPDINGTQLMDVFMMCRDQYLFYPWNTRDAAHRRPTGLPTPMQLHTKVMEALKSAAGFRPLIRAAFRYPVGEALTTLSQPALISADGALFRPDYPVLTEPPSEPISATEENLARRAAQINQFLAA
jgi:pimeloyl-ACP methyl ester carboxylesterase